MNRIQLFMALAYAARQAIGRHVAVVVDGWAAVGLGEDTRAGDRGAGTAIANALQNLAASRLDGCDIYTTANPTDLCCGMSRICRIRAIYVVRNGQFMRIKPEDPVTNQGFTPVQISQAEMNQVRLKAANSAPDIARTVPNVATIQTPGPAAFAWWREATRAQNWYQAPANNAVASFDSAPTYANVKPPEQPAVPAQIGSTLPRRRDLRDTIFMVTAYTLAAATWDRIDAWRGNKVACILVDPLDRIVAWGINMRVGQNVTWHGETVALRSFLTANRATELAPGYRLYTTLKPCHMCAGMVAQVAPSMTIIYGQDDPEITNSTLDRHRDFYPQFVSTALRTPGESFPQLLRRLLQLAQPPGGRIGVIPFLENMSEANRNATFGSAARWLVDIVLTLERQHADPDQQLQRARTGGLAYLDLAVPDEREIRANLVVLCQVVQLLRAIRPAFPN